MKKVCVMLLSLVAGWASAQAQVALKSEGLDSSYVQTILGRSQKIVDGLGLADAAKAEAVRNIIANRYFLLNEIHSVCEERLKYAKDSVEGRGRRERIVQAAERRRDAELYKHHFELQTALAAYLTDQQIEAVKDGFTYGRVQRDYNAQQEMIPSLTDEEKAQILAWLKEAREFAMDAADSKAKHAWFDKYRGRTNNWLSARGYDLKKEREQWQQRIEQQKAKQK